MFKEEKKETKKIVFVEPPHFFMTSKGKEAIRLMVRDTANEKMFKAFIFNEGVVQKIKKDSNLREGAELECYGSFSEDKFGTPSFIINQIFKDGDNRTLKERTIEKKGGEAKYSEWLKEDSDYYKRFGLVKVSLKLSDGGTNARWQKQEDSCMYQDKWEDILEHCSNILGGKEVTERVVEWCKAVGFSTKVLGEMPKALLPKWRNFKLGLLEEANEAPQGIMDKME